MRALGDLRFIVGLYRYMDQRLRLYTHGLAVMVIVSVLGIVLVLSTGAFDEQHAVAADQHTTAVRREPRPEYVPQQLPPTTAWPAHGPITATFGSRTPAQRHHSGIDIGGHYGDPITAYRAGTVTVAERSSVNATGLGRYVMIDHGGGVVSVYGHLSSVSVTAGQTVGVGTVIGKEGSTGQAYGVHLHFEIRINGKAVDPKYYVAGLPLQ